MDAGDTRRERVHDVSAIIFISSDQLEEYLTAYAQRRRVRGIV